MSGSIVRCLRGLGYYRIVAPNSHRPRREGSPWVFRDVSCILGWRFRWMWVSSFDRLHSFVALTVHPESSPLRDSSCRRDHLSDQVGGGIPANVCHPDEEMVLIRLLVFMKFRQFVPID